MNEKFNRSWEDRAEYIYQKVEPKDEMENNRENKIKAIVQEIQHVLKKRSTEEKDNVVEKKTKKQKELRNISQNWRNEFPVWKPHVLPMDMNENRPTPRHITVKFQSEEAVHIKVSKIFIPCSPSQGATRGYSTAKQKGNKKRRKIQEPDDPSQKKSKGNSQDDEEDWPGSTAGLQKLTGLSSSSDVSSTKAPAETSLTWNWNTWGMWTFWQEI